jgi:hypothetical protein
MGIATGNIINFLNPATCGEAINLFLLPEIGKTGVTPFLSLIKRNLYVIQINQPTRCNNFSSLLLDVYVWLNMFQASSRPSSGAQQLQ